MDIKVAATWLLALTEAVWWYIYFRRTRCLWALLLLISMRRWWSSAGLSLSDVRRVFLLRLRFGTTWRLVWDQVVSLSLEPHGGIHPQMFNLIKSMFSFLFTICFSLNINSNPLAPWGASSGIGTYSSCHQSRSWESSQNQLLSSTSSHTELQEPWEEAAA